VQSADGPGKAHGGVGQYMANNTITEPVGSTPVPDPTLLTTAALTREIAALKELVVTRLDAMDKAQDLFSSNLNRVPTDTDKQIQHLRELVSSELLEKEKSLIIQLEERDKRFQDIIRQGGQLFEEKFLGVQTQFKERDVRVEQTARDTKVAVDAALQAAEKAVSKQNEAFSASINKSELATSKQIDQQGILISSSTAALNDKIDDIKERLTRIEGAGSGSKSTHDETRSNLAMIVAIISVLIAVTMAVVSLTHQSSPVVTAPAVVPVQSVPAPVVPR
jgi:hypothetical protein